MLSSVITLRVFKGLYDLFFSDERFYVDSRAELKNGVGYSIEQFREGYSNPRPAPEKPVPIRKPFKIMLAVSGELLIFHYSLKFLNS
jgi:hypothetical protein